MRLVQKKLGTKEMCEIGVGVEEQRFVLFE